MTDRLIRSDMTLLYATLLQILLVVLLGAIEGLRGFDHCDDGFINLFLNILLDALGSGFLLGRMKEDRRAILSSVVRSLAVELRRIVELEKQTHQLLIRHFFRIEREFHN